MKPTYGSKVFFLVALLLPGSFACGQDIASAPAAKSACGPENVKFKVDLDQSQPPMLNSTSGKAVIYIVQYFPAVQSLIHYTTRIGVDGAWVGANQNRSYISFMVDPGVHHLCISGQSRANSIALHRIEAKAGETYYFGVRFSWVEAGGAHFLEIVPVDEDQGQFILQTSKHSTAHPK
jgi:hypothetical protein